MLFEEQIGKDWRDTHVHPEGVEDTLSFQFGM
jgi:hypothetical protein